MINVKNWKIFDPNVESSDYVHNHYLYTVFETKSVMVM